MQKLIEGTTSFVTESEEKITRGMPVFYNPVMKLNRDLSLLVMSTMDKPKIGLPMEASGVRAARMMNELKLEPHELLINDISPRAIEIAKLNVSEATFTVMDANVFMRLKRPFDYLDIDPFGSPNPFLDAAVQGMRKNGILAVTATDTSAFTDTYPRTTARKYWSKGSRTWAMHDLGLRILIRKVQLIAAQYKKALIPLISVSADHYYRIFFRVSEGVEAVKRVLKQHDCVTVANGQITLEGDVGPLWVGKLHDADFVKSLLSKASELDTMEDASELLTLILDECSVDQVGFYDVNELASLWKAKPLAREKLFKGLGKACRTHISPTGFKTNVPFNKLKEIFTA